VFGFLRMLPAALLLLALIGGQTARADDGALCDRAIATAEAEAHLPPGLLRRIGIAESGRPGPQGPTPWPWTINADGQGQFFETRGQALLAARQAIAAGHTYVDVGCMQIDLAMHKDAFRTLEEAFDPLANARYAARFLRQLYAEAADWDTATGYYHSRTPELAAAYRDRVAGGDGAAYGRLVGRPGRQFGWVRLALAGGGTLVLNVRRQPRGRPQHLTSCQMAVLLQVRLRGGHCARPKPRPETETAEAP
jgi:hypothetical protein